MAPKISSALIRLFSAAALIAGFTTTASAGPPDAERVPLISISDEGTVEVSAQGFLEERLALPPDLPGKLGALEREHQVRLENWPVAPGDRRTVTLKRSEVYGSETRIFEVGDHGIREVPRSPRKHFIGAIDDEPGSGVLVILDPRSGTGDRDVGVGR